MIWGDITDSFSAAGEYIVSRKGGILMAKRWSALVIMAVLCFIMVGPAAAAPTVFVDGRQLSFDVPPTIENERILVPLRVIFEALGATVVWDQNTQTVTATKSGTEIILTIGQNTAFKNGAPILLGTPSRVIAGRTLVPIRFVSESLGAQVDWDDSDQRVIILSTPRTGPAAYTVNISNFAFSPASIIINKGDAVTWVNLDSSPHDVVGSFFSSPMLAQGQSYTVTFSEDRTYNYRCGIHPDMQGVVIVQGGHR